MSGWFGKKKEAPKERKLDIHVVQTGCMKSKEYAELNKQKLMSEGQRLEKNLETMIRSPSRNKQEELALLKKLTGILNQIEANDKIIFLTAQVQQMASQINYCKGDPTKIQTCIPYICTLCYLIDNIEGSRGMQDFLVKINEYFAQDMAREFAQSRDPSAQDLFKPITYDNPKYIKYCQDFVAKYQLQDYVNEKPQYNSNSNNIYQNYNYQQYQQPSFQLPQIQYPSLGTGQVVQPQILPVQPQGNYNYPPPHTAIVPNPTQQQQFNQLPPQQPAFQPIQPIQPIVPNQQQQQQQPITPLQPQFIPLSQANNQAQSPQQQNFDDFLSPPKDIPFVPLGGSSNNNNQNQQTTNQYPIQSSIPNDLDDLDRRLNNLGIGQQPVPIQPVPPQPVEFKYRISLDSQNQNQENLNQPQNIGNPLDATQVKIGNPLDATQVIQPNKNQNQFGHPLNQSTDFNILQQTKILSQDNLEQSQPINQLSPIKESVNEQQIDHFLTSLKLLDKLRTSQTSQFNQNAKQIISSIAQAI